MRIDQSDEFARSVDCTKRVSLFQGFLSLLSLFFGTSWSNHCHIHHSELHAGGIDALAPVDVSAWNALSGGNEEQRNIYKNYYGGITCGEGLISGVQNGARLMRIAS